MTVSSEGAVLPPADAGTRDPCEAPGRGERGSGVVAAITLVFALTFGGVVWLARDVDRGISNRSAAGSIAFQAARSAAQAAAVPDLRASGSLAVDPFAARAAAQRTASALFASYGVAGRVTSIDVGADRVTVTVGVSDGGQTVTGVGTVRTERTP